MRSRLLAKPENRMVSSSFEKSLVARDAVPTKKVWEHTQKIAISNQLQTHFKAKHEKSMGTLFQRVPAPLHLGLFHLACLMKDI